MNGGQEGRSCTVSQAMEIVLSPQEGQPVCARNYSERFSLEMQTSIFTGSISGAKQLEKPPVLNDYISFISINTY